MGEKYSSLMWLGKHDWSEPAGYVLTQNYPRAMQYQSEKGFFWTPPYEQSLSLCESGMTAITGIRLKRGQLARCKVTIELLDVWDCEWDEEAEKDYEVE